ncbi:MAG: FeoC-like transcriptional regulator [Thiomicrorhabdus sp.]|nr:FeoC-like transcriptional regulator [Thiomicrorhabdus sp.]MCF6298821.1 FeoC-like transcriptional regulator [Thiomicrorhabdus sp.]
MILLDLKRYIKQHQNVTLRDIQAHFDLSEDAALGLLSPLLQQGHVLRLSTANSCSSQTCHSSCAQLDTTPRYQWSTSAKKPLTLPIQLI